MTEAYVGIGSNADPERRLRAAVDALARRFGALRCSPVYRSAAENAPAPDYLNMVVALATESGCDVLKEALLAIEASAGRIRSAPRSRLVALDLDVLLYGRRIDGARRLPHPDVRARAYVLAPLASLEPELVHPLTGEPLARLWTEFGAGAAAALRMVGAVESLR